MVVTKVFKAGNSAAVRLPKEIGLAPGTEVELIREGRDVLLRPVRDRIDVDAFWGKCPGLTPLTDRTLEARPFDWGKPAKQGD